MFQRFSFAILMVILTACSSPQLHISDSELTAFYTEAQQSKKSADELIAEYDNKIKNIDLQTLQFYSPLNIDSAESNKDKAELLLNSPDNQSQTAAKRHLIIALKNIEQASKNMKAVKLHLKKADKLFLELKRLDAPTLLPRTFTQVESKFIDLIYTIELGETQKAINQEQSLIDDMIALEIDTLIKIHLDEASLLINKSIELNADSYAPTSLEEAKHLLIKTTEFIKSSYRDRNEITLRANKTKQKAERLFQIAKEAHFIHSSSNLDIEKKIREDFEYIDKIKLTLNTNNLPYESYRIQQSQILDALKTKLIEQDQTPELVNCTQEKQQLIEEISQLKQDASNHTQSVISKETNKAVLPELLFNPD